ncbi:hypothetical protein AWW66_16475 [Micromonospora rosaria]|uniref:Peptidase M48 domain-containing protein n=2 Tax=Micromonospora rosaria TaxID=47874 RepID=A0A136PRT0_9ACTN|nr:M56 family metallopeptidase [Micromonospora rosaria]KXK60876.1 hypothetical protein AWW66_16475 [Micromonospora rosaria]
MDKRALQWEAYRACSDRYAAPPPWWWLVGWWTLLAAGTAVLFGALPRWKARRSRVVPLATVDRDGEIRRVLADLSATAGLTRPPRVVVDPAAASAGAVVFGRTGRATICLHGGLVAARTTDPRRFRAVLLHELAHIANRDVTVTYLTVALWRVYLAVALPPFLLWCGWMFRRAAGSLVWSAEAPIVSRGLLTTGLLAVLVYLARSEVLRSREVYADRAAVRWGADPTGWATPAPATTGGYPRRALRAFTELWHPHPRWDVRRAALTDPAVLFGLRALPLFLTGAAAAVTHTHASYALTQYALVTTWMQHAAAVVSAALVAGVVGIALWRAVVYAALTGQPPPSSLRSGLWLGLGLAVGGTLAGQGTVNEWLPARPWLLLLVVLAATAFTWWLTQSARLWVVAWRGRSLRPVALLNVSAAALGLSLWFFWWHTHGVAYTAGWMVDVAGFRDYLVAAWVGRELDHPPASAVDRAWVLAVLTGTATTGPPLGLLAVAGAWVVPLLAWLPRPGTGPAPWVRAAAPDRAPGPLGPPLPGLRRVLGAGLPGAGAGVLVAVAVLAWLHARARTGYSATSYTVAYLAGMTLVLLVAAAVAAVAARRAVPAHRLPAALVAAGAATLLAFAALVVLRALDGCVPALSVGTGDCALNLRVVPNLVAHVLVPALPLTALVAGLLAAPRPRAARALDRPGATAGGSRATADRPGTVAARVGVAVLAVTALGIATLVAVQRAPYAARMPEPAEAQRAARRWTGTVIDAPVSARSRAMQVDAWLDRGGDDLLDRFYRQRRDLFAAVTAGVDAGRSIDRLGDLRPRCVQLGEFADDAARYFRIPDPEADRLWESFVEIVRQASQGCVTALDTHQADLFNTSMRALATAQQTSHAIDDRIDALIALGGW